MKAMGMLTAMILAVLAVPDLMGGEQEEFRECSIGSSLFMLGNLVPGDPPYYAQLNFGYYLNPEDALILEAITWTYYEPMGTYGKSEKFYDGRAKAFGIGAGYQCFFWKGMYASFLATPFFVNYHDKDGEFLQSGFQLYLQARLGYRFNFFMDRWFLEPSAAFNYWPINTNLPASFKEAEKDAPPYIIEPGLHFGYRF